MWIKILTLIFGIAGFFLVIEATSLYGSGLSPDSVSYISAARNLSHHHDLSTYDGNAFISWPPLFPMILAIIDRVFGVDPVDSARYLNAIIFGLIIILSVWIIANHSRSPLIYILLGGTWILFSEPILAVSVFAWSESLFILFTIAFLAVIENYLKRGNFQLLLLCSSLACLATLTRYIGYTLVVFGFMSILLFYKGALKDRLTRALMLVAISTFPIAIWLVRNYLISNTLFGLRAPSSYTFDANLQLIFDVIVGWFLPVELRQYFPPLAVFVILMLVLFLGRLYFKGLTNWDRDQQYIIRLAMFIGIYISYLIITSTIIAFDPIDNRLLSPMYIPLIMLLLFLLERASKLIHDKRQQMVGVLLLLIVGVSLFFIHRTTLQVTNWLENGAGGYNRRFWRASDTIRYLDQNPQQIKLIYSNDSEALYILLETPAIMTPSKTYYNSEKRKDFLEVLMGKWLKSSPALLIWFNNSRNHLFTIEELNIVVDSISPVAEFTDGTVYIMSQADTK